MPETKLYVNIKSKNVTKDKIQPWSRKQIKVTGFKVDSIVIVFIYTTQYTVEKMCCLSDHFCVHYHRKRLAFCQK